VSWRAGEFKRERVQESSREFKRKRVQERERAGEFKRESSRAQEKFKRELERAGESWRVGEMKSKARSNRVQRERRTS
jgi:hypothetical protein